DFGQRSEIERRGTIDRNRRLECQRSHCVLPQCRRAVADFGDRARKHRRLLSLDENPVRLVDRRHHVSAARRPAGRIADTSHAVAMVAAAPMKMYQVNAMVAGAHRTVTVMTTSPATMPANAALS